MFKKLMEDQKSTAEEKLAAFFKDVEAFFDEDGGLQIKHSPFSNDMAPHCEEFAALADCVVEAYGETGLPKNDLGRMIHQFRYYIDEHNIKYIRRLKKNKMNDYFCLSKYSREELDGKALYRKSARFHNRRPAGAGRAKLNKKYLTRNYHSEFILDANGDFVTQWDVLTRTSEGNVIWNLAHYRKKYEDDFLGLRVAMGKLANTESFNYDGEHDDIHDRVDVQPCTRFFEPGGADGVRIGTKEIWKAPSERSYKIRRYCFETGDGISFER